MKKLELWYFYGDNCSICQSLGPKVEALMQSEFPRLHFKKLRATEHRELAGQQRMLSVPGLLFFVEGREYFRANGLVTMGELRKKIQPAYEAYFEAEL